MVMLRNLLALMAGKIADLMFTISGNSNAGWLRTAQLFLRNIKHGTPLSIGCGVYIRNCGDLRLGDRCSIGSFTRIWNYAPIKIGNDFMSAGGLTLNSATHDPVTLAPIGKPITIGNRVWCGQNVTILAGITIGDDVVLGAGSVVVDDVPAGSVVGGVPARKIRDLNRPAGTRLHHPTGGEVVVPKDL